MTRSSRSTTAEAASPLPAWIKPQLTRLVTEAPNGDAWAHELKYDGYRMHARLDRGDVHLLTRTGLDWTGKYPAIAATLRTLPARQAYLDGELCGVRPDGVTSFALIQNAAERRGGADLVYFVFDLLHLDGRNLMPLPLADRKAGLAALIEPREDTIRYSEHQVGQGPAFRHHACALGLEGVVSKRLDAPIQSRRSWALGQGQMPQSRGVRRRRLDRPRGQPTLYRCASARVLRSGRETDLCRPGRYQLNDLLKRLQPLRTD